MWVTASPAGPICGMGRTLQLELERHLLGGRLPARRGEHDLGPRLERALLRRPQLDDDLARPALLRDALQALPGHDHRAPRVDADRELELLELADREGVAGKLVRAGR